MKPHVPKSFVAAILGMFLAISWGALSAQTTGEGARPSPSAAPASPTPAKGAPATKGKKAKPPKDTGDPTLPPKQRKAKDIPFPVPVGRSASVLKVPSYDQAGKLLSVLIAAKANHIDPDHVQLEGMTFDLNGTDGKDAYKIEMPTSVLDLRTNIVTSDHAVTIRTKEFELTGERVEFNTVERSGELHGRVHMIIHNLKQVATPGQPSPEPQ